SAWEGFASFQRSAPHLAPEPPPGPRRCSPDAFTGPPMGYNEWSVLARPATQPRPGHPAKRRQDLRGLWNAGCMRFWGRISINPSYRQGRTRPPMAATMHDLLTLMIERGASDLHITTGTHPQIRPNGKLTALTQFDVQMPPDTQRLAYSVLNEGQKQKFEEENELDLSFGIQGLACFRCNVYRQRGAVAAAIRVIPVKIRGFDELGLPAIVEQMADRPKGLILVTGPTGSGKSTTLAAMVDKVN